MPDPSGAGDPGADPPRRAVKARNMEQSEMALSKRDRLHPLMLQIRADASDALVMIAAKYDCALQLKHCEAQATGAVDKMVAVILCAKRIVKG